MEGSETHAVSEAADMIRAEQADREQAEADAAEERADVARDEERAAHDEATRSRAADELGPPPSVIDPSAPDDDDAPKRAPAGPQQYGVLVDLGGGTWEQVGIVEVPPRTRRNTVLETALEKFPSFAPEVGKTQRYLILDAESAVAIPVTAEIPPPSAPTLRIGESS